MHERLKHLIQKSKELFSLDFIDKLSKKSKRKGSVTTTEILNLLIKSSDCPLKLAI